MFDLNPRSTSADIDPETAENPEPTDEEVAAADESPAEGQNCGNCALNTPEVEDPYNCQDIKVEKMNLPDPTSKGYLGGLIGRKHVKSVSSLNTKFKYFNHRGKVEVKIDHLDVSIATNRFVAR